MIHNRQFILAKQIHSIDDTWVFVQLKNGYYINYQQNLHVECNSDRTIAIIGDAWQVDPDRESPYIIINKWDSKTTLDAIYAEEDTWSGRYLIITEQNVLTDATGNLGCFYSQDIVSSSVALIHKILFNVDIPMPPSIVSEKQGGAYIAGPLTMTNKIRRLLPSFILNYLNSELSYRKLLYDGIYSMDEASAFEEFKKYFLHGIESMLDYYQGYDIWLPISGGRDSRICLAAFEKLSVNYNIYVFQNENVHVAGCYEDLGVSRLLSKKIRKHLFVFKKDKKLYDSYRAKEFEQHTAGMATMSCKWQYTHHTLKYLENNNSKVVQIRNNVWELVCNYYTAFNTPEKVINYWRDKGENNFSSIQEWVKLVKNDKINEYIDFGDRAYWDLRCGCWLSDGLQGFDIFDNIETVNVFNCRRYISILMGLDSELRRSRAFEEKLANQWFPLFSTVPYTENYIDVKIISQEIFSKIKRKLKKFI